MRTLGVLFAVLIACEAVADEPVSVRIATYNILDVRTDDLSRTDHPRLRRIAATLQRIRPDIVLINEIAFDQPGVPGFSAGGQSGRNGQRLADHYLAISQGEGLEPIQYRVFMAPSNTGQASGFDLNHDGRAVTEYPTPDSADAAGNPAPQTEAGRAYGNDNWGFGTFPGQYAMAVLARDGLAIRADKARTFQRFLWSRLPGARRPIDPLTGAPWYSDEVWSKFPLSSKSHWDVPIELPTGAVLHLLASHPTPPAFDGAEMRNRQRNHDEIRFWAEYLNGGETIEDDEGLPGGLADGSCFVIAGDLNADPDEGSSIDDPIGHWLFADPQINGEFVPLAEARRIAPFPRMKDADDTSTWGARIDYVLPSSNLTVIGGAVDIPWQPGDIEESDHFPVWIDLVMPTAVECSSSSVAQPVD